MRTRPTFIIGVGRSGTTLLRTILDCHSKLAVGPENPWICKSQYGWTTFEKLYRDLTSHQLGPVANMPGVDEEVIRSSIAEAISRIMCAYAANGGKEQWIDKTPVHIEKIPLLLELFPDARFIHLVRDGRDVACSSQAERAKSTAWTETVMCFDEPALNTRLNALRNWCRRLNFLHRQRRAAPLDMLEFRYEDLVATPEAVLRKTLDFIDVEWEDAVLDFGASQHDFPSWEAGSRDVAATRTISSKSVGKWKRLMCPEELQILETFARPMLDHYGYE